jgi:hypothetical protein
MKMQNVLGVAVLVLLAALIFQTTNESPVSASAVTTTAPFQAGANAAGFEYARLVVFDNNQNVQWQIGGQNNFFPKDTVANTFSRLGGRGPNRFSDLLNQIGSQNWKLVQKDGSVWIFIREAS